MRHILFLLSLLSLLSITAQHQELPVNDIKSKIRAYKNDIRGPYYRIKWFCNDGTIRDSKDPCPDDIGGGIQHASYKPEVEELGKKHHIFFGDILAYTNRSDFWDSINNHSRLKQYQMGKYLASVDDGWILRKGQYYRGAIQSEDEQAWGIDFYKWVLGRNSSIDKNYFLLRQSLRDIPHDGDSNLAQMMRSQSKVIADEYPDFMDIRIKIHAKPSKSDIPTVNTFYNQNKEKLTPELRKEFEDLRSTMTKFYAPIDAGYLRNRINRLKTQSELKNELITLTETIDKQPENDVLISALAKSLYNIRTELAMIENADDCLELLDISNDLEDILLRKTQEWNPDTLQQLLFKIYTLSHASAGTGLIEVWEWKSIYNDYQALQGKDELSIQELNEFLRLGRSVVEWSAATVKANYEDVVERYAQFEPLAYGFIDDRIRSSVALYLGDAVSRLGSYIAKESSIENKVMNISAQSQIRGLNPGYAYGKLNVITDVNSLKETKTDEIYIFQKPPSDLKPVAGIMTVSEGNLVSHVQLLARNLGIPNAALSDQNLKELKGCNGEKVFYAVTDKGSVVLKQESQMTAEEKALFQEATRNTNKITVPVDQIRLDVNKVLNMSEVNAKDSGKLCGPKAANLGQLKELFPEQVVEGLVIPFGIFKDHMNQPMPGTSKSYWEYLNSVFAKAEEMRKQKTSEAQIETYQIAELNKLQQAIKKIELKESFVNDLKDSFKNVFKAPIGEVPVFLRSDTNMEDLKEFTGAGLNLTLFNILDEEKIIQGIKDVWASPYTERSFKWRQQYLLNPENVFPSILIIPSVDVDYSGVMITKGINVGNEEDLTVAFSRGAGGAVDGQSAETRLVLLNGTSQLLSPAREADYIRLPETGGTKPYSTTFEEPILNRYNIYDIAVLATLIRKKLADNDHKGAFDVEFGFKDDKLWLFQIRPFVENKNAKSSEYLNSISPKIDYDKTISTDTKI